MHYKTIIFQWKIFLGEICYYAVFETNFELFFLLAGCPSNKVVVGFGVFRVFKCHCWTMAAFFCVCQMYISWMWKEWKREKEKKQIYKCIFSKRVTVDPEPVLGTLDAMRENITGRNEHTHLNTISLKLTFQHGYRRREETVECGENMGWTCTETPYRQ